jgi:hypothetical protein
VFHTGNLERIDELDFVVVDEEILQYRQFVDTGRELSQPLKTEFSFNGE